MPAAGAAAVAMVAAWARGIVRTPRSAVRPRSVRTGAGLGAQARSELCGDAERRACEGGVACGHVVSRRGRTETSKRTQTEALHGRQGQEGCRRGGCAVRKSSAQQSAVPGWAAPFYSPPGSLDTARQAGLVRRPLRLGAEAAKQLISKRRRRRWAPFPPVPLSGGPRLNCSLAGGTALLVVAAACVRRAAQTS